MTATGSEWFYGIDGKRRPLTIQERLVLTDLEGLNLRGIGITGQKRLLGNMVQVSFAQHYFIISGCISLRSKRSFDPLVYTWA
jgi:hypothetical protein